MSEKKLGTYTVEIPIVGSMTVEVKAHDEAEAIELAWETFNESGSDEFDVTWEAVSSVTDGNVCHAPCNNIEASRHKDE